MESVSAPPLLPVSFVRRIILTLNVFIHSLPDISLSDQAGPVASPVAACPTRALVQKLVAVLEGRLNLALLLVLNPGLPLVAHEPTSHKVVIVSVQNPLPPLLVLEAVKEVVARQNLGTIGASASRHARCAAVNVVGSRDLKVATLNVSCAQPVPGSG